MQRAGLVLYSNGSARHSWAFTLFSAVRATGYGVGIRAPNCGVIDVQHEYH